MKTILLISILTTLLLAQNPKIYTTLGDTIYDNANKITKLKELSSFSKYSEQITKYISDIDKTKQLGFDIESGKTAIKKDEYLKQLRELSKTNDFFVRAVKKSFELSIKNKDNELFTWTINSGLLQTQDYKKDIIDYYCINREDINSSGLIQKYLDEDSKLIKHIDKKIKKQLATDKKQDAKIKRIRAKDLAEQEAVNKSLEDDMKRKKAEIIKEQKKELEN
jgi:hypothetical protein